MFKSFNLTMVKCNKTLFSRQLWILLHALRMISIMGILKNCTAESHQLRLCPSFRLTQTGRKSHNMWTITWRLRRQKGFTQTKNKTLFHYLCGFMIDYIRKMLIPNPEPYLASSFKFQCSAHTLSSIRTMKNLAIRAMLVALQLDLSRYIQWISESISK